MVWYLYLSETPDSHFETVCLLVSVSSANCSCDIPAAFLISLILVPIVFSAYVFLILFSVSGAQTEIQHVL